MNYNQRLFTFIHFWICLFNEMWSIQSKEASSVLRAQLQKGSCLWYGGCLTNLITSNLPLHSTFWEEKLLRLAIFFTHSCKEPRSNHLGMTSLKIRPKNCQNLEPWRGLFSYFFSGTRHICPINDLLIRVYLQHIAYAWIGDIRGKDMEQTSDKSAIITTDRGVN